MFIFSKMQKQKEEPALENNNIETKYSMPRYFQTMKKLYGDEITEDAENKEALQKVEASIREKAKALIDNLTIVQNQTSGVIPTALVFRSVDRTAKQITLNCCFADVKILMRMHELTQRMNDE